MSLTPDLRLVIRPVASAHYKFKKRHSFAFIQVFPAVSVGTALLPALSISEAKQEVMILLFTTFR